MKKMMLMWILNAVALLCVAYLLPGIHVAGFSSALLAALVLGIVNTLIRPLLVLLTIPISLLTLGLFLLVVNALMFWLAGSVFHGFEVAGFWDSLFGAMLYSVLTWGLSSLLPGK